MTSYTYTTTGPLGSSGASRSGHSKLRKRGGSDMAQLGPSNPSSPPSRFATSYAPTGDTFPDYTVQIPSSKSTPVFKPYMRKMSSSSKGYQGQLDLSKSTAENAHLAGLGIQDMPITRSAADVTFARSNRSQSHARNVSGGSQISTSSSIFRPGQAFTHPMKQTPRPYTPPSGTPYATSVAADDDESGDIVDDDFRFSGAFRSRRSVSTSSTPQTMPTPLSQSHTASDLGLLPKLTSPSTSNLSIKSTRSSKSKPETRPRRDTERSLDHSIAPSPSRTSFDKAFSFVSRRSETEPLSREDMIRAARRKFDEKEATKDRKHERDALRRRATEEAKAARRADRLARNSSVASSERSLRSALKLPTESGADPPEMAAWAAPVPPRRKFSTPATAGAEDEKFAVARDFDEPYRPNGIPPLPRFTSDPGMSEKPNGGSAGKKKKVKGGWARFQARVLSCGAKA